MLFHCLPFNIGFLACTFPHRGSAFLDVRLLLICFCNETAHILWESYFTHFPLFVKWFRVISFLFPHARRNYTTLLNCVKGFHVPIFDQFSISYINYPSTHCPAITVSGLTWVRLFTQRRDLKRFNTIKNLMNSSVTTSK